MESTPLIISHAACGGHAPENTLAGISAALGFGADAIEIDVHASADGVPVVIHDSTLERTTNGHGRVSDKTFAELRVFDAGAKGFEGRFAGERIPALSEAADLVAGRCLMIVEVKQQGIAPLVVDTLRRANALRCSMVWSFDIQTVAAVRDVEPLLSAALLTRPWEANLTARLDEAQAGRLTGVSLHHLSVTGNSARAAKDRGLSVYAWTADKPEEQQRLRDCGIDAIVTNYPDVARKSLAGL